MRTFHVFSGAKPEPTANPLDAVGYVATAQGVRGFDAVCAVAERQNRPLGHTQQFWVLEDGAPVCVPWRVIWARGGFVGIGGR